MPESSFDAWEVKTLVGSFFAIALISFLLASSGAIADEVGEPPSIGEEVEEYTFNVGETTQINGEDVTLTGTDPIVLDINGTTVDPPGTSDGIQAEVVENQTIQFTYQERLFRVEAGDFPTLDTGDGSFTNRPNTERKQRPIGQQTSIGQSSGGDTVYLQVAGSDPAVELSGLGNINDSNLKTVTEGEETQLTITTPEDETWTVTVRPTKVEQLDFDGTTAWVVEGEYTIEEPEPDEGITSTLSQIAETILFIGQVLVWGIGFVVALILNVLLTIGALILFVGELIFYIIFAWLNIGALIPGVLGLLFQGFTMVLFLLLFNGVAKLVKMLPTT